MPGPRDYLPRDVKKLYSLARNMCSNPSCRRLLVIQGKTESAYGHIGKIAHICGANDTSARFDPNMTYDERRRFPNLILLCGICHDLVDDVELESEYPVEMLRGWKDDTAQTDWLPGDHIEAWGQITIHLDQTAFQIPYFRTSEGLRFFSESQWQKIQSAFYVYIEIISASSALEQAREMNRTFVKTGLTGQNSIMEAVEMTFSGKHIPQGLLPEELDLNDCTLAQRVFSLMQGNELSLEQLTWLAINSQTSILAPSIDSAFAAAGHEGDV